MAYALAAGNRVMLKPSEHTPRTSELLCDLLAQAFPADRVGVVLGGPEVGAAFSTLPFDHLFFTGSSHIGKLVMRAAADNLTPVTLELGGKSPVLIHPDYPVSRVVRPLLAGKLFNSGQTCIAPDYVLVRRDQTDALVQAIVAEASRMFPTLIDNADYSSLIHERHANRMVELVDDAVAKGGRIVSLDPASEMGDTPLSVAGPIHKLAPTLVLDPKPDMRVMEEEIFGPILPIVEVESYDDAIDYIVDRPRPLALYIFDSQPRRIDDVILRTHAGGVCVNDTVLHAAEENLPFGGIGNSGMGAYHGKEGFDTFSHRKPILHQARLNARRLTTPPYGAGLQRLLDWLI